MGLDMYLWEAKKSGQVSGRHPAANWDNVRTVAYWRKANAVHDWFVRHAQGEKDDCAPYIVSREQVAALLGLCEKVSENRDAAPGLLPTAEGFFFGSTEYDEMYFDDIALTIRQCRDVLETFDFARYDLVYRASW